MKAADLVAALDLPESTRLDQRVPKKLLVENGAPTAADKRRINEGIEDIVWVAALKPTNIGVPEYCDDAREYLEIALLTVALRPDGKGARLAELIHRAVPYPVVLLMAQDGGVTLSLAHKRWSQGDAEKVVLDGELICVDLRRQVEKGLELLFLEALAVAHQPRSTLFALYQGWMDTVLALQVTRLTGRFTLPSSPEQAQARHKALRECESLEAAIAALRSAAGKEKQIHRQVELNLEQKQLQSKLATVREML
jgi:hypothetical protein